LSLASRNDYDQYGEFTQTWGADDSTTLTGDVTINNHIAGLLPDTDHEVYVEFTAERND